MSIRAYKLTIAVLLCVVILLAWRYWVLFGQVVWADFIDKQCRITQESFIEGSLNPQALALSLDFLIGYYDAHSKALTGSHLEHIIEREYRQTLTNAVAAFRISTTNDLGSDPRAWIEKYEH